MKFGRTINGEIHTERVDTIVLTVGELRRLQAVAGPGRWINVAGNLCVLVSPDPQEPRSSHVEANK